MAWRITFDAAMFDVLMALVEVGRLEACGVEPDPDTTTSPRMAKSLSRCPPDLDVTAGEIEADANKHTRRGRTCC